MCVSCGSGARWSRDADTPSHVGFNPFGYVSWTKNNDQLVGGSTSNFLRPSTPFLVLAIPVYISLLSIFSLTLVIFRLCIWLACVTVHWDLIVEHGVEHILALLRWSSLPPMGGGVAQGRQMLPDRDEVTTGLFPCLWFSSFCFCHFSYSFLEDIWRGFLLNFLNSFLLFFSDEWIIIVNSQPPTCPANYMKASFQEPYQIFSINFVELFVGLIPFTLFIIICVDIHNLCVQTLY